MHDIACKMSDADRKSLVLNYLHAFDHGGVTAIGTPLIDLFASDARVYFPKWGLARGTTQISTLFADVGATISQIRHRYDDITWIMTGTPLFACEGMSDGAHRDGAWEAGNPESRAGRWCDVFEIDDGLIHRCFIYLDPDYAGRDVARYPWLT